MSVSDCDVCGDSGYPDANPFVEARIPRPSDPRDMCCVLAGHRRCLNGMCSNPPTKNGGRLTPGEWQTWIETEGRALGFLWLS